LPVQSIPRVPISNVIGLLGLLENEGGFEISELSLRVDVDLSQLLQVVQAAELLRWVTAAEGYFTMHQSGSVP